MKTSPAQRIEELTRTGAWGGQTLHDLLAANVEYYPQRLAVCDQPDREQLTGDTPLRLSWAQLAWASDNLAAQLRVEGVAADDRIVIQLPNVAELLLVYYALSKLGAIASPVPVQYGRHELASMVTALDATALITLPRFRQAHLAERARAAVPALRVLVFGDELRVDTTPRDALPDTARDANQVFTICWTSGTTGTPKGVPRSHNLWLASARCTAEAGSYTPDDILLNPFPMVNMSALGGFVYPAALFGCTLVLHHPLDPPLFLRQMQNENISFTIAPPALLNQLAKTPELWRQFDFSALRAIGSGSAPLSAGMIETFRLEFGVDVINIYGSNEGIALYATPANAPSAEVRAAMFPQPVAGAMLETRVVDPLTGDQVCNAGERGELLVRGATVFDGYFAHDNADVFSPDGFFHTGDLVEISGGPPVFYRIVGRCKDIINRGGMKISPQELDLALEQHPDIAEAAVCAYADERLGEKICACLVMRAGTELMAMPTMQDYLLGQGLAKFKLPERIVAFDALPRNALGKVQRFALQDSVAVARTDTPDQEDD